MKQINFKSKDGKEFNLKVPESSEEIENNEFIQIDDKMLSAEDISNEEGNLSIDLEGELVYSVDGVYELYYYNGDFYDYYWDTASGCILSKLTIT